ncbi:hypothetical protein STEG23_003597, partial [Scotinomys teguina]
MKGEKSKSKGPSDSLCDAGLFQLTAFVLISFNILDVAYKETFVCVVDYIDVFSYVEPFLYLWDEAYLIMVDDLFDVFLDSYCQYFIEYFCINVHEGYSLDKDLSILLISQRTNSLFIDSLY